MPKQIRCSNCHQLGHNKKNPVCKKYLQNILLGPTSRLDDGIELTEAVNKIKKYIDKHPGILTKENCVEPNDGGFARYLPLHWVCMLKCPKKVVQLVYEKYPEAINIQSHLGMLPLHCAFGERFSSEDFDWPPGDHRPFFRKDVVRFLISKNPDARTQRSDCWGQIPLHMFCKMIFNVSEEDVDGMLLNCPETLWSERNDNRNGLKISVVSNQGGTDAYYFLARMMRKQIVHYAREFKSTNSHERFFHLFKSNCFDPPTLKLYCEEWPEFAYFDLDERGARPLHIACSALLDFCLGHIRYLITRAPDVLTLQDSDVDTLHCICF
jgi:hypothetical protein